MPLSLEDEVSNLILSSLFSIFSLMNLELMGAISVASIVLSRREVHI